MSQAQAPRWTELPPQIDQLEALRWRGSIALPLAVTGATGFIGSHLVEAVLGAGIRPRILVRDVSRLDDDLATRGEIVRGDLDDRDALRCLVAGAGTVVHLAGVVRAPNAETFDRANRVGTENLVAAMKDAAPAARLLLVSSLSAAGPSSAPAGKAPDDPAEPVSAYGRSKLAAENAVQAFPGPSVILRPPTVYGPRDIDVLQFFRLAARHVVPIPAGERWVSVAYVTDVVRAIMAAAAGARTAQIVHLGEPEPYRIVELIRLIAESGGVRAKTVPLPAAVVRAAGRAGDLLQILGMRDLALTSDKAGELLARHWTSQTASSMTQLGLEGYVRFSSGARITWDWYRERGWVPRAKMRRQC